MPGFPDAAPPPPPDPPPSAQVKFSAEALIVPAMVQGPST